MYIWQKYERYQDKERKPKLFKGIINIAPGSLMLVSVTGPMVLTLKWVRFYCIMIKVLLGIKFIQYIWKKSKLFFQDSHMTFWTIKHKNTFNFNFIESS